MAAISLSFETGFGQVGVAAGVEGFFACIFQQGIGGEGDDDDRPSAHSRRSMARMRLDSGVAVHNGHHDMSIRDHIEVSLQ